MQFISGHVVLDEGLSIYDIYFWNYFKKVFIREIKVYNVVLEDSDLLAGLSQGMSESESDLYLITEFHQKYI